MINLTSVTTTEILLTVIVTAILYSAIEMIIKNKNNGNKRIN